MTTRDMPKASGADNVMAAAAAPTRESHSRRPNQPIISAVTIVKISDGNRAANSSRPKARSDVATTEK